MSISRRPSPEEHDRIIKEANRKQREGRAWLERRLAEFRKERNK